jgi:hypothetical protein
MMKISDCFIKKFLDGVVLEDDPNRMDEENTKKITAVEFNRHRHQLYRFYQDVTEKVSDYKIWRLIGRVKGSLKEPIEEIKEIKMKEIRCLMKINWHVEIETMEIVERTLAELVKDIYSLSPPRAEEKQFVSITCKAIEDGLKRKCTVPEIE